MPTKRATKARSTFGRVFQRRVKDEAAPGGTRTLPGYYIRARVGGREVTRYAGPTRTVAVRYLARLHEANAKQHLLGERTVEAQTFAAVKGDLVRYFKAHHTPETFRGEAGRIGAIVEAFPGPIGNITSADVAAWRTVLKSEGRSAATVNRYVSALSAAFRFAIERGYAAFDPTKAVPREREEERAVPYLSDGDMTRIIGACPDRDGFRALVRVLADVGLRRGEALRLSWRDVDLSREWKDGADVVAVGAVVVKVSKSKKSRVVPLTEAARSALLSWREERLPVPMAGPDLVWPALAAPPVLDPARTGGRKAKGERKPDPSRLTKAFQRAARRAGFPDLRLHDCRHSFCSRLAQRGVPLATVGALAGHSDGRVTLRYASHLPEGAAASAIGRLSAGAPRKGATRLGDSRGDLATEAVGSHDAATG